MKKYRPQFFEPKPKRPKPVMNLQLNAMVENQYWTVLNSYLLAEVIGKKPQGDMKILADKANTVKHQLQTYGPILRDYGVDFRQNTGRAAGEIFHSNMKAGKTMYVMEWTVLDEEKRIMTLLGFGPHENYDYAQKPLTAIQQTKILDDSHNKNILDNVKLKIAEAKEYTVVESVANKHVK
ncbi:MAG: hypothetical protein P1U36_03060 [Legionellaceae bacterium]|nr:hypothetical protein [Legionellaceae bacterium]